MNTDSVKNAHHLFASFFEDDALYPFIYLLSKAMEDGHICVDMNRQSIDEILEELPQCNEDSFNTKLLDQNPLVSYNPQQNRQPFVWVAQKLYTFRYWQYEQMILKQIINRKEESDSKKQERTEKLNHYTADIKLLQGPYDLIDSRPDMNTDWQYIAAINAYISNFSIITGGPGTGKTTTISKILQIILTIEPDSQVILAAPTGKAAARMKESLQGMHEQDTRTLGKQIRDLRSQTIHQLLGSIRDSIYFKHNEQNPLPYDVIIVDEASMIDVALMAKLLQAIKMSSRIIFLGDKNQLASVEAGSIFGDLCLSVDPINHYDHTTYKQLNELIDQKEKQIGKNRITTQSALLSNMTTELMRSFRFSNDGKIGIWARSILNEDIDSLLHQPTHSEIHDSSLSDQDWDHFIKNKEDVLHDPFYSENLLGHFCQLFEAYILEDDIRIAIEKMNKARILCATKMGPQGTEAMNRFVENYLKKKKLLRINGPFYENRPIMVRKNNRGLGLSNGDIGLVRKDDKGNLLVYFLDEEQHLKAIQPAYLGDAQTVFAMTIHKSQGSEYTNILTCLPKDGLSKILTKELLYTAVTRAKKRVIIQSSNESLIRSCQREVKRASGIIDSLQTIY